MRRMIFTLIVAMVVFGSCITAFADYRPSAWATGEISGAMAYGIVPNTLLQKPYTDWLTRIEMCELLVKTYESQLVVRFEGGKATPFTDTNNPSVAAAYELGLVSGVTETLFEPQRNVTRQEFSKALFLLYSLVNGQKPRGNTDDLMNFDDADEISGWAKEYVAALMNLRIIGGYGEGGFKPLGSVSVEQAIVMSGRLVDNLHSGNTTYGKIAQTVPFMEQLKAAAVTASVNGKSGIDCEFSANTVKIKPAGAGEGSYLIVVSQQRNSVSGEDIAQREYINTTVSGGFFEFEIHPNRKYYVTAMLEDKAEKVEFTTSSRSNASANRAEIEAYGNITTEEDAAPLMKVIEVNIWKMKENGDKYAGTLQLTVHTGIAEKIEAVFKEIFEGDEKFPIKDAGGYAWRAPMSSGRLSEHNLGTAIDINYNENYCVYSSGSAVGNYWKPYEDPYSITPYGDVVNAFEKYGFTWGGDAWSNPRDYMHFSYCGR